MSVPSNLASLRNERSAYIASCRKKATELLYEANRFELANIASEILLHFPSVETVKVRINKADNWLYVVEATTVEGVPFGVKDIADVTVFFESMEPLAVMDFAENNVLNIQSLSRLIPLG